MIHNYDKTNISRHNYKKIQDDLIRLDTSIERIQEEFKKSIEDIKGELQQSVGVIKVTLDKLILVIINRRSNISILFVFYLGKNQNIIK